MTLTDEDILEILKVDLQVSSSALDLYLLVLITSARAYIAQEGITLADTAQDAMLVEMYAAYLYRRRREEKSPSTRRAWIEISAASVRLCRSVCRPPPGGRG